MLQEDTGKICARHKIRKGLVAATLALPLSLAGVTGAHAANDIIIGAHEAGSTY